ncbi:MAG: oligopeptide/dipeptide ABC transporter ATP-binding protein, partial [Candidatus Thorarchaeota archaeon]
MASSKPILEVKNLKKWFPVRSGFFSFFGEKRYVKAVDDVSFEVPEGGSICIVGESGCGKTTLARTILRLVEPTGGEVYFEGENIYDKTRGELAELKLKMQLIFQNPFEVLDPRLTIETLVGEGLHIHKLEEDPQVVRERVFKALEAVRLVPARNFAEPKLVIADEPVSMLDASIRTEVMNLMTDLQKDFGHTYIFITHDLAQARYIGDFCIVMYLGRIAEMGPMETVILNPIHPYTKALVSNIPVPDPTEQRDRIYLEGETPTPIDLPEGCRFKPRCQAYSDTYCKTEEPNLIEV